MSDFTYEQETTKSPLETYEWDNIWWEQAPHNEVPRVLVLGDSISCGYRRKINDVVQGQFYVDGYGTSKALDHPCLMETVRLVLRQQRHTELIQINNGLHGWHLSLEQYEDGYEQLIKNLMDACPNAKMVVALTTPVQCGTNLAQLDARNQIVLQRNEIAATLAQKYGFPVNDFYSSLAEHPELYTADGVHLVDAGYEKLAKQAATLFLKKLK